MENQQQQSVTSEGLFSHNGGENTNLPKLPPAKASETQWQQIIGQILSFLEELPDYLASLFQKNKQALFTLVLIISALVTVKVVLAVLDAINGVPLLAPFFETIGIIYAVWFIFRYLIKAATRQELVSKFSWLKEQTFGA